MKKESEEIKPLGKAGVICKKMGEETVLYDPATEALHVLNPTSHFIWNLCDGEHSLEAMIEAIRSNFSDTEDQDIRAHVQRVLAQFESEKLLETR